MREEKRPVHTSSLPSAEKVQEVLEGREIWNQVEFWMEPQIVRAIAALLRRENFLRDTRDVAVEEQLCMFLYMMSHNASKKKQSEKIMEALLQKKCLDTINAMEELTDEEKAAAAEVLESDINREMFMVQKNLNVRLIWLRRKISRLLST